VQFASLAHAQMAHNFYMLGHLSVPFMVQHGVLQEEFEQLIEPLQIDMMSPGFNGYLFLADISAKKGLAR
jgi:hypothetical protein